MKIGEGGWTRVDRGDVQHGDQYAHHHAELTSTGNLDSQYVAPTHSKRLTSSTVVGTAKLH
jgi:hypothetical protein